MGDAGFLLSRVRFVAQGVAVDDARSRIGEQREGYRAAVIGGEKLRELPSLLRRVGADRVDLHLGIDARKLTKSGQLPGAVRSPVAAVEDQHHLRPGPLAEADVSPVLIEEREGGRLLAGLRWSSTMGHWDASSDGEEQNGDE